MIPHPLPWKLAPWFITAGALVTACAPDNPTTNPATNPAPTPITNPTTAAPEPLDPTLAQIREEGLNHSHTMDTLNYLCNIIGQRLTGSPNVKAANEWTRDQFNSWGLANAHLEPWGPFGRGWSLKRYNLQVISPQVIVLNGYPKAWSPGYDQPLEAPVVYVNVETVADLDSYRGTLKGKVVLLGAPRPVPAHFGGLATRQDDQRLAQLATLPAGVGLRGGAPATSQAATESRGGAATTRTAPGLLAQRAFAMVADEEPALIIDASTLGDGGTIFVTSATVPNHSLRLSQTPTTRPWVLDPPKIPPQITLAVEDYNRLVRMIQGGGGQQLKVSLDLQIQFHTDDPMQNNTIAEIPGSDLADQIVMAGAHLDSWQSGTGATDNGTGSAAVMEAARILQTLHLKPRRTIRFALWTGEEQGLLGSKAYVKSHYGYLEDPPATVPTSSSSDTPQTATSASSTSAPASRPAKLIKASEYEQLSIYFNIDTGTGRIRGIAAQSNPKAVPIFKQWIKPFNDLGAATITLGNMGSTDLVSFDTVSLPGFGFVQDAIEYATRTHHSNEDVYDRIQPDDVKQAATILASLLWQAANTPDRFPRKTPPDTQATTSPLTR